MTTTSLTAVLDDPHDRCISMVFTFTDETDRMIVTTADDHVGTDLATAVMVLMAYRAFTRHMKSAFIGEGAADRPIDKQIEALIDAFGGSK